MKDDKKKAYSLARRVAVKFLFNDEDSDAFLLSALQQLQEMGYTLSEAQQLIMKVVEETVDDFQKQINKIYSRK